MSVDLMTDPFGSTYPFEVPVDESWSPAPTADEVAVLAELERQFPQDLDRPVHSDDLPAWDRDDALGFCVEAGLEPVDSAAASEIVAAAERPDGCGAEDLALLEATDPASLDDPLARIEAPEVLCRSYAGCGSRLRAA